MRDKISLAHERNRMAGTISARREKKIKFTEITVSGLRVPARIEIRRSDCISARRLCRCAGDIS